MTYAMKISTWQKWRVAAVCFSLLGGILCALLGSLLTAISWFVREPHSQQVLHTLGGAILCLTIPLLVLGGLCMDGLDADGAGKKVAPGRNAAFGDDDCDDEN